MCIIFWGKFQLSVFYPKPSESDLEYNFQKLYIKSRKKAKFSFKCRMWSIDHMKTRSPKAKPQVGEIL